MKATPEMIQTQLDRIDTEFETFMVCIKSCVVEMAAEIDKLKAMVLETALPRFDNVTVFPGNGRKPKLLKAEQTDAGANQWQK
jgi:hypothetical protein